MTVHQLTFLRCQQCSAALAPRPGQTLNACAFCGSHYLVPTPGAAEPQGVRWLPFTIGAALAKASFTEWLGTGLVRPGDLVRTAGVREPVAVLVPLYLARARAHSNWNAEVVRHRVKKVNVVIPPGGEIKTGDNVRMRTDSHFLSGTHDRDYQDVFLLASRGVSEAAFDTAANYDFRKLEPMPDRARLDVPYEEPQVTLGEAQATLRGKIEDAEYAACRAMVPGGEPADLRVNTTISDLTCELCYVPLWLVSYRYRDTDYRALVNGSTGQVGGDAPFSGLRMLALGSALIALPAAIAYWLWRRRRS